MMFAKYVFVSKLYKSKEVLYFWFAKSFLMLEIGVEFYFKNSEFGGMIIWSPPPKC